MKARDAGVSLVLLLMAHEEVPSQVVQQILNCQYQEWYPQFKSLAFRSDILPLPKPFVSYLLDDGGVFLPESSDALPKRFREGDFSAVDNEEYRRWGEEADAQEEDDKEHMQAEVRTSRCLERAAVIYNDAYVEIAMSEFVHLGRAVKSKKA